MRRVERRINRYRDRQIARLERMHPLHTATFPASECGKRFTAGSVDEVLVCVFVRPAGHDGTCCGQWLRNAVAADVAPVAAGTYLVPGSESQN